MSGVGIWRNAAVNDDKVVGLREVRGKKWESVLFSQKSSMKQQKLKRRVQSENGKSHSIHDGPGVVVDVGGTKGVVAGRLGAVGTDPAVGCASLGIMLAGTTAVAVIAARIVLLPARRLSKRKCSVRGWRHTEAMKTVHSPHSAVCIVGAGCCAVVGRKAMWILPQVAARESSEDEGKGRLFQKGEEMWHYCCMQQA